MRRSCEACLIVPGAVLILVLGCGRFVSAAEAAHGETVAAARILPPHATTNSPATKQGALQAKARPIPAGFSDRLRMLRAERLRQLGYPVDWRAFSLSELTQMERKAELANRARELGYPLDWKSLSLSQMEDRSRRIEVVATLRSQGVNVGWEKTSYSQLVDLQTRVTLARRLAARGIVVDWRKFSTSQLSAMLAEAGR